MTGPGLAHVSSGAGALGRVVVDQANLREVQCDALEDRLQFARGRLPVELQLAVDGARELLERPVRSLDGLLVAGELLALVLGAELPPWLPVDL